MEPQQSPSPERPARAPRSRHSSPERAARRPAGRRSSPRPSAPPRPFHPHAYQAGPDGGGGAPVSASPRARPAYMPPAASYSAGLAQMGGGGGGAPTAAGMSPRGAAPPHPMYAHHYSMSTTNLAGAGYGSYGSVGSGAAGPPLASPLAVGDAPGPRGARRGSLVYPVVPAGPGVINTGSGATAPLLAGSSAVVAARGAPAAAASDGYSTSSESSSSSSDEESGGEHGEARPFAGAVIVKATDEVRAVYPSAVSSTGAAGAAAAGGGRRRRRTDGGRRSGGSARRDDEDRHWRKTAIALFVLAILGAAVAFILVPRPVDVTDGGLSEAATLMRLTDGSLSVNFTLKFLSSNPNWYELRLNHFSICAVSDDAEAREVGRGAPRPGAPRVIRVGKRSDRQWTLPFSLTLDDPAMVDVIVTGCRARGAAEITYAVDLKTQLLFGDTDWRLSGESFDVECHDWQVVSSSWRGAERE